MNQKTLFISDLHLDERNLRTSVLFLNFLNQLDDTVDALYILGDFFDVWIGDDDLSKFHLKIQQALRKASQVCPIYFLPGNRDFLIGKRFTKKAGIILLKDPSLVYLYGIPTLLMHGDSLCIYDVQHLRFRAWSQHPLIQFLFLSLPLKWRRHLAATARKQSRQHLTKTSSALWEIPESEVNRVMKHYGVNQMIHGHTHKHLIYPVKFENREEGQRIALGDWEDSGSMMICEPKTGRNTQNTLVRFHQLTY